MPRRHRAEKRDILPDAKYKDQVVSKFMSCLMYAGKRSLAERIVYGAFDRIELRTSQQPITVFHDALNNVRPLVEVRSRRVGGATYQVPVEVRPDRGPGAGNSLDDRCGPQALGKHHDRPAFGRTARCGQ